MKFVLTLLLKADIMVPPVVEPIIEPLLVKFKREIEELLDPATATLVVFERVTPVFTTKSSPPAITTVELVLAEITCA
jgi:hypothetical protein